MIVKVQTFKNDDGKYVLISNQDRSILKCLQTTPDTRALLHGVRKAYYHAEVTGRDMTLTDYAPVQNW